MLVSNTVMRCTECGTWNTRKTLDGRNEACGHKAPWVPTQSSGDIVLFTMVMAVVFVVSFLFQHC